MVDRDLQKYFQQLKKYTELRLQENRNLDVTLLNGNVMLNERTCADGVSARVCRRGSWGFSSVPGMGESEIMRVLESASVNADFIASKQGFSGNDLPGNHASAYLDRSTKKTRKTQKEIVDFLREVDAYIASSCRNLSSRRLWFGGLEVEKSFLNSDGATVYSMTPRTRLIVFLSAAKDGEKADLYWFFGGCGEFEDVFGAPSELFPKIDEMAEHLNRKLEGTFCEAGTWDCVLSPEISGILAHEAIGHTAEADNILAGSVAGSLLGYEVASPLVSLTDFANTAFGEICPVPVYGDDEGVKAEDVRIIEKGTLRSYLHNKESAVQLSGKAAGNARAAAFSDEPIIRMRNTAILPGTSRLEEMIASIDKGYYLLGSGNGQADSTSEFMFGVIVGYEIRGGRIGNAIKDTSVSGIAYDVLKTVSMVSNGFRWINGAMCYKTQAVPVGFGGPEIKCRINMGGR